MAPAVELRGICKKFGHVAANDGIDLSIQKGSIHAIVGENGAGKSTAMKLLYGMSRPDSGEILIDGETREWKSPRDAIHAGIGMVHQHFMLAGPYTALENVVLTRWESDVRGGIWRCLPRSLRPIDWARARRELTELSTRYGFGIDWDAPVESLAVGVQQRVEIVKLLYQKAAILILDEPTAVLTPHQTEELFKNLKKLAGEGKTIAIITHKLKEVMSVADRATVFRAGKVAGNREISATSCEDLAALIVGRKVSLTVQAPPAPKLGPECIALQRVQLDTGGLTDLSLSVRGGEVVGIAGVEGNGQSELLKFLLDPLEWDEKASGSYRLFGDDALGMDTAEIRGKGVAMVPEDRHRDGLLLDRPLTESFLLGLQREPRFQRRGFLDDKAVYSATRAAMEAFDVRPRLPGIEASKLSGGNQQKLIIARELSTDPKFLIAAQPTRGVDIGAIESIHGRILDARARGVGVLLISSELDEILALSDRILVIYQGRINAEYARGQAGEQELGLKMCGAGGAA